MTKIFDLVIFGATGFTGKYVVDEVNRLYEKDNITWAVAGRNKGKLTKTLQEFSAENNAEIIIADVTDQESLVNMCKQSRVVLDCVGPYRFFGEQVVQACIEAACNYVDISGEPQFLENMQLKYSKAASDKGIYIVGACGFDSIPSDLGVEYARSQFKGLINSIDAYLELKSGDQGAGIHFATYESAVHGFGDASSLRKIRKSFGFSPLPSIGPKRRMKGGFNFVGEVGKYTMPFPGADAAVVKRSQRHMFEVLKRPPIQYSMYLCISNAWSVFLMMIFGGLFAFLAGRSWGRKLLLNHPSFFTNGLCSHKGPSAKQMEGTSFSITMSCLGYSTDSFKWHSEAGSSDVKPNKKMTIRVAGPEPGYIATPILLVQSALVIIKEKELLPVDGGVYAPAAAFCNTSLIKRLQERGISFSVVEESNI